MDQLISQDPIARARELGPDLAEAADEVERTKRIP